MCKTLFLYNAQMANGNQLLLSMQEIFLYSLFIQKRKHPRVKNSGYVYTVIKTHSTASQSPELQTLARGTWVADWAKNSSVDILAWSAAGL